MPYSPKTFQKSLTAPIGGSKFHPRAAIINDRQCHNHVKKASPKPLEMVDPSIQEMTSILDERMENSQINITENHLKIFSDKTMGQDKVILPSHDVSVADGENPLQTFSPVILEKKFILTGKNNKGSMTTRETRDTSMSTTDRENTPHARPKAPLKRKNKPSHAKKVSQTFDVAPLEEVDFDEGNVNEHPEVLTSFNLPMNISKYETKVFSNPHHGSRDNYGRKVVTEYITQQTDFSPERDGRAQTERLKERFTLHSKLSISPMIKPKNPEELIIEHRIPCLVLKPRLPTNKVIIYFHGNGEDIHLSRELLAHIRDSLNIIVIAVEYPGYGLYKGTSSEQQIQSDAEAVFDYLTTKMNLHPRNIVVFGRSIGSGPATWLASRKNIGALVLMSAFTSIRAVVHHLAGKWAQYLIKERFNNLEHISRVTCPTFIVHGLKDRLIPFKHAQQLYNKCRGLCELVLPKDMDHIEFDFSEDFTVPLIEFLGKISFGLAPTKNIRITFGSELFQPPQTEITVNSFRSPRY
jgi:pimeloyl-ACP methyl ester carboxylesterase